VAGSVESARRSSPEIGVLALQGAFREHAHMLARLGVATREVRLQEDLEGLDGLIIPGGESTTMGRLMAEFDLVEALRAFARRRPVLGTCAGLIIMASRTTQGRQPLLGLLDITVRRNAFGSQVHSFEADVELDLGPRTERQTFPGVFIRAPWVEEWGPGVRVIARCGERVVGVEQGALLGVAFHPELTQDMRIHEHFLRLVSAARR